MVNPTAKIRQEGTLSPQREGNPAQCLEVLVSRVGIEPTTRRLRAAAETESDRSRPRKTGAGCSLIGATDCRSQPFGAPCSGDPLHGATRREPIVAVRGAVFSGSVAPCNEKRARVRPGRSPDAPLNQPGARGADGVTREAALRCRGSFDRNTRPISLTSTTPCAGPLAAEGAAARLQAPAPQACETATLTCAGANCSDGR